jgi:hypothetical protein
MSIKVLGVNVFQVDTEQKHELGVETGDVKGGEGILSFTDFLPVQSATGGLSQVTTRRIYDPHGKYRYVKAVGANIAAGDAVASDRTVGDISVPHHVIETATEANLEGIAMAAIPLNSFGWIQVRGKHFDANVLDAVADDAYLEGAAGGTLIAATNDVAYLQTTVHGVSVRKICDASVLGGAVDKGVVEIRS